MTELQEKMATIEAQVNALFVLQRDGLISPEDLAAIEDMLTNSIKLLSSIKKAYETPIKKLLDFQPDVLIGNKKYYYHVVDKKVFDADKAKKLLDALDYNLDDFYKVQISKTLKSEIQQYE